MDERAYFDALAHRWDSIVRHDPSKIERILSLSGVSGRVLDVGCGTGALAPFLSRVCDEILAIDISEAMIFEAKRKRRHKNVRFLCGDALDLSLETGKFNAVICYSVFPHFADKSEAAALLAERLLPDGRLIIAHSQGREEINRVHKRMEGCALPPSGELEAMLSDAGLRPFLSIDESGLYMVCGLKNAPEGA